MVPVIFAQWGRGRRAVVGRKTKKNKNKREKAIQKKKESTQKRKGK